MIHSNSNISEKIWLENSTQLEFTCFGCRYHLKYTFELFDKKMNFQLSNLVSCEVFEAEKQLSYFDNLSNFNQNPFDWLNKMLSRDSGVRLFAFHDQYTLEIDECWESKANAPISQVLELTLLLNVELSEKFGFINSFAVLHEIKYQNIFCDLKLNQFLESSITKREEFDRLKKESEEEINLNFSENEKKMTTIISKVNGLDVKIKAKIDNIESILNKQVSNLTSIKDFTQQVNTLDTNIKSMKEEISKLKMHLDILKYSSIINNTFKLKFIIDSVLPMIGAINMVKVYDSILDGESSSVFHEKIDNIFPNLVIVEDKNGNIYGGYTTCNWAGNDEFGEDNEAFLFSLNEEKIFNLDGDSKKAIYKSKEIGPCFGEGPDLRINDTKLSFKLKTTYGKSNNSIPELFMIKEEQISSYEGYHVFLSK